MLTSQGTGGLPCCVEFLARLGLAKEPKTGRSSLSVPGSHKHQFPLRQSGPTPLSPDALEEGNSTLGRSHLQ